MCIDMVYITFIEDALQDVKADSRYSTAMFPIKRNL